MKVRPAVAEDLPAIADVHVRSWQEAYAGRVPQDYLNSLSVEDRTRRWEEGTADWEWPNPDLHVLVDDDEVVVGFVTTSASRDPDAACTTGEVPSIYTRQRVWGQGCGRALMEVATGRLKEAGFEEATLWVLDTNTRLRSFYEATGWRWDGTNKPDTIGGQHVTELRYRTHFQDRTDRR